MHYEEIIIAFTGKANAGKDSMADLVSRYMKAAFYGAGISREEIKKFNSEETHVTQYFVDGFNLKHINTVDFSGRTVVVNKYSFASPIKDAANAIFGFTPAVFEDRERKETVDPYWGFSPRKAAQLIGTELFRESFGADVWIKSMRLKIDSDLKKYRENGDFQIDHKYNSPKYNIVVIPDCRFDNEAEFIESNDGIIVHVERADAKKISESNHVSETGLSPGRIDIIAENVEGMKIGTALSIFRNVVDLHKRIPTPVKEFVDVTSDDRFIELLMMHK